MAQAVGAMQSAGFGATARRDFWWVQPLAVFLGLSAFAAYATWAAFQGVHYRFGPYLSPFYSPELFGSKEAWFGPKPGWWPVWLIWSPALLILWAPGGFRLSCYYYRGAYYKAFWADPPSCAVGEPRSHYHGEASFPLIIQNIHRYFLYLAVLFVAILFHDAWHGIWFTDPASGQVHFGLGVGSFVLLIDACLLGGYTFGCHSLRHLVGGRKDILSRSPLCAKMWHCATSFNQRHMAWAWCSLFWVGFTDFYVRMCSMGVIHDWRIF